jgi:hypothetical protein
MVRPAVAVSLVVLVPIVGCVGGSSAEPPQALLDEYERCTFSTTGHNPFFVLEVGWRLVLADDEEQAIITVTDQTKMVDGVETRVVLEEESLHGEIAERSWNYFGHCEETGSVFYFGEEVDIYEDGAVARHEGEWLAGEDGAVAGIMMPGEPRVGVAHYQEFSPDNAMDHAEIVAVDETVTTPAGTFTGAIKVKETTDLEPGDVAYKWYAPDVGVVVDESLKLTRYTTDA